MSTEENFEIVEETTEEETLETNDEILEQDEVEEDSNEDIDYEAELEALKEEKKKNFVFAKARVEAKKAKEEVIDTPEEPEDDTKDTVLRVKQEVYAEMAKDIIEDELARLSNNPKKQELIRYHYENSVLKTGISRKAILNDLENAYAITEKRIAQKRKNEESEAVIAQKTIGRSAGMGGGASKASTREEYEKVLTPSEIAFGKKRGWTKEMFQNAANAKKRS